MMRLALRRVSLMLLLATAVLLSHQQVAALEMKGLAKGFINRYTSGNGFDQLNTLVTSPFAGVSRDSETVFRQMEDFLARPESRRPRNRQLADAAEQFLQLKRKRGEQACELDTLESTLTLQNNLNAGLPLPFSPNGLSNTHRRQLLRIFRQVGRENARFCLERYQRVWTELTSRPDWLGGPEEEQRISQRLGIFQEETSDLSCEKRFESVRPTVQYFECALHSAEAPFSQPDDVHDLRQTLERIQLLEDNSQKALTRLDAETNAVKPKSSAEISALISEYLRHPCEKLLTNETLRRLLKGIELFATMFGLPDDLFHQYNTLTDYLVKWTGKLVLCERLLERTDANELALALAQSSVRL